MNIQYVRGKIRYIKSGFIHIYGKDSKDLKALFQIHKNKFAEMKFFVLLDVSDVIKI